MKLFRGFCRISRLISSKSRMLPASTSSWLTPTTPTSTMSSSRKSANPSKNRGIAAQAKSVKTRMTQRSLLTVHQTEGKRQRWALTSWNSTSTKAKCMIVSRRREMGRRLTIWSTRKRKMRSTWQRLRNRFGTCLLAASRPSTSTSQSSNSSKRACLSSNEYSSRTCASL